MQNNEKSKFDDFWDIEKLVPQKKKTQSFSSHTYDTSPVEVIVTAKEHSSYDKLTEIDMRSSENSSDIKFTVLPKKENTSPEPYDEYSHENPFIKNVKIYKRNDFNYYAAFLDDGLKYLTLEGEECEEPPFFSYVPQYSQLDAKQRSWYFYMRTLLRQGNAPSVSYSYILIYIFELINVEPNKQSALDQLSFIWKSYRDKYPKLDPLLCEWITDFCLINRMEPDSSQLGNAVSCARERGSLKELFICPDANRSVNEIAQVLLDLCSNYDWKNSKFATAENLPLYEKHIIGALRRVLSSFGGGRELFSGEAVLERDAFAGALCVPHNKYRIKVSYYSIARSHEMRFLITDAIKYAENKIRAYIGVKSRLTVYSLPTQVRGCIDEYMDMNLKGPRAPKQNEYDKLYDVPKREFSIENAKKIEENSWETTQILIEAFGENEEFETPLELSRVKEEETSSGEDMALPTEEEALSEALRDYIDFIKTAIDGDKKKQAEVASSRGRMIDSLADEINEIAAEVLGDIILENNSDVYTVIEEYAEVLKNAGKQ
ncbi:MAG: TerB N-terminal domain-containing protein [Clostridia bacterium]|nr:TerB N-terminal domain-containing protein [Clostridia bacterium]